jgi:hypothetical protein
MDRAQVHFEMFVRRHARAPWVLALATEDRHEAFEAAEGVLAEAAGAAVRLCKETRDPETGDFRPLVLLERGARPEPRRWRPRRPAQVVRMPVVTASCVQPEDLYGAPARASIGRFLAGWLERNRVTAFELLHRADLAERLEACEAELAVAIYNAATEQAAAGAAPLEQYRQALAGLVRRTIERVVEDKAAGAYRFGALVAGRLARRDHWRDKVEMLLDLVDAAQREDGPGVAAVRLLQQPLIDILGVQGELDEILGAGLAPGDQALILLQIAAAPQVAETPTLARALPPLRGLSARLALTLHRRAIFVRSRAAMARRALGILAGPAPLWAEGPAREAEGLKLFKALLATAERLIDRDEAAAALTGRWRRLAEPGRLEARLDLCPGALEEADVLIDLIEAAVGRGAIDGFGRRLLVLLDDAAFERELRFCPDPPAVNLRRLASLATRIRTAAAFAALSAQAEPRLHRLAVAIAADAAPARQGRMAQQGAPR